MKSLGQFIRELRQVNDISLRELAGRIGVSPAFMSDVELGRRNPSDSHLGKVAEVFGVSVDELLKYDTRPPVREFHQAALADPGFGLAFRQVLDKQVSAEELLEFIRQREEKEGRGGQGKDA